MVDLILQRCGGGGCYMMPEFFTANIRNPNTRRAYARAASGFLSWCEFRHLTLVTIQPTHVAA
jgi:hypothetical protein